MFLKLILCVLQCSILVCNAITLERVGEERRYIELNKNLTVECVWTVNSDELGLSDNEIWNATENVRIPLAWRCSEGLLIKVPPGLPQITLINSGVDTTKLKFESKTTYTASETEVSGTTSFTLFDWVLSNQEYSLFKCNLDLGQYTELRKFNVTTYAVPAVSILTNPIDLRQEIPTTPAPIEATTAANVTDYGDNMGDNDIGEEDMLEGNDEGIDNNTGIPESEDGMGNEETISRKRRQVIMEEDVATCLVNGIYPMPNKVEFKVGEEYYPVAASNPTQNPDGTYSFSATLRLEVSGAFDGLSVSCAVAYPDDNSTKKAESNGTTTMEVLYDAYEAYITINNDNPNIGQDESFEIVCSSNGNPAPKTFEVVKNGDEVVATGEGPFEHQTDQDSSYQCRTYTRANIAIESDYAHLRVTYLGDVTVTSAKDTYIQNVDSQIQLTCSVGDSLPEAQLTWSTPRGPEIGNRITRNKFTYEDAGEYTCTATNGVESKSDSKTINVQGKCIAEWTDVTVGTSAEDGTKAHIRLQCRAKGSPQCSVEISSSVSLGHPHSENDEAEGNYFTYTVVYNKVDKQSAAVNVTCRATNNAQLGTSEIVKVLDDAALINQASSAGLGAGVIVLIIIIVVVVVVGIPIGCYYVNKKRKSSSKDMTTKDADLESKGSAEDDEEREKLNAQSEESLPPPPSEMHDERFGQNMSTFSTQK